MRLLLRLACLAYWIGLTVLLLSPDPKALLGLKHLPGVFGSDRGVHFLFFTGLTLLVHTSTWPRRLSPWLVGALVAYALTTETLQHWIPPRTVEFLDYLENLLGIGTASVLYAAARRYLPLRAARTRSAANNAVAQQAEDLSDL